MYFNSDAFRERLKNARKNRGYTQEELASKLSVPKEQISRIERGARNCTIDLLAAIAEELHVSSDILLFGKESRAGLEKERLAAIIHELTQLMNEE